MEHYVPCGTSFRVFCFFSRNQHVQVEPGFLIILKCLALMWGTPNVFKDLPLEVADKLRSTQSRCNGIKRFYAPLGVVWWMIDWIVFISHDKNNSFHRHRTIPLAVHRVVPFQLSQYNFVTC